MGRPHLSMADWFYLFLAVAGLLLCLGLSVRQMLPSRIPTTRQGRIRQSLIGGTLTGGFLIAILAITFILDKQATWSLSDFISIVLCCAVLSCKMKGQKPNLWYTPLYLSFRAK